MLLSGLALTLLHQRQLISSATWLRWILIKHLRKRWIDITLSQTISVKALIIAFWRLERRRTGQRTFAATWLKRLSRFCWYSTIFVKLFNHIFLSLCIVYWYCGYCTFLHIQDYGLSLNTPSKIAHCIFSVLKVIELSQLIFYVHFKMLTFNPDELSSRVATLNAFESWKPLAPNVNPAMLLLVSLVTIFYRTQVSLGSGLWVPVSLSMSLPPGLCETLLMWLWLMISTQ